MITVRARQALTLKPQTDRPSSIAVVTGGNGSIGRAVVERFLKQGTKVVSADRLLATPHPDYPALDLQVSYDASDRTGAQRLVEAIPAETTIQHLVLAAGIYPEREFAAIDEDEWQHCLDINLSSVFRLVKQTLPLMTEDASIVFVSSIAGLRGSKNHAHYAASKAGLLGLMRSLMWELGDQRRVNTVSPGIIANPMTQSLRTAHGDSILSNTPLNRYGEPDEVAAVIEFLCSPAACYIQGENISVNGGFYVN